MVSNRVLQTCVIKQARKMAYPPTACHRCSALLHTPEGAQLVSHSRKGLRQGQRRPLWDGLPPSGSVFFLPQRWRSEMETPS
jgi:hypothetical protein